MAQGWDPGAEHFGGGRGKAAWRLTSAGRGALPGAFVPRSKRWRCGSSFQWYRCSARARSRRPRRRSRPRRWRRARPSGPILPAALNPATSSSPLIGTDPTPRELARERFHGYFSGPVSVGGGRFGDQAKTLYFQGLGGSSMFLHGDYQMAIVFPADPTQPLFGEAYLQDKSTNSGGQVGFVLQGTAPQTYDKLGRPTSMTFSADPNINSGIFFSDTASGTLQIHYSKGSATAIFNGLVYTTGLTSPLANSASTPVVAGSLPGGAETDFWARTSPVPAGRIR